MLIVPCAKIEIVKKKKNGEYKVSLNFFLSWSKFFCSLFETWKLQKTLATSAGIPPGPPLTHTLFSSSFLVFCSNPEKKKTQLWANLLVFHCNTCKILLQQWETVKRLLWCTHTASYYMLISGRKLDILSLWVKLTISIKHLAAAQIVSLRYSKVQ